MGDVENSAREDSIANVGSVTVYDATFDGRKITNTGSIDHSTNIARHDSLASMGSVVIGRMGRSDGHGGQDLD